MKKIHIIAEAGTNHGGKLETAKKLAKVAQRAGADSVKYQIIYPEGLYLPKFYQDGIYIKNDVFVKRKASMLSDDEYRNLCTYCVEIDIPFSASVFDERGLNLLNELNVPYYKFASCDLNNTPLLIMAALRKRKMIISTGMATLDEITTAVNNVLDAGNEDIVLMHCVSVYPCPTENMNISFIKVLKDLFGLPVGLSDHTESSLAAIAAVGMGVEYIEKHFTYDRKAEGFDHAYAMEPQGLKSYIDDVRLAENACFTPNEKIGNKEAEVRCRARRSLYASRDIAAGEILAKNDILIVRPESHLKPIDLNTLLGKTIKKALKKYQPFSWDML